MTPLTRIQGYAHVAARYGLEEAIFLDAIVYWYRMNRADNKNFRDGRWWTYNTMKAFDEAFPWWSAKQLRRIASSCKDKGAILTGNYNEDHRDRTLWYSPSDEALALYGETAPPICPNGQMQNPDRAQSFAQTGTALPCNNHVGTNMDTPYSPPKGDEPPPSGKPKSKPKRERRAKTVPDHCPERFEQFWAAYPGGGSRQKASAAWDRLKPDDALIDQMARALKQQMRSRQWQEGIGIPHASTWLNQERWTDKLPQQPPEQHHPPDGGWAPDPEVTS